ncbi:MAG: thioredoxin family protein [Bacteroidota bacterium]|nr:thioredoxin family protein [Bacteroidota bacterium]
MSTLLKELGLFTYESYLKHFEEWVKNGETSSRNPTQALIDFTKLNFARTQRIHKTISINPVVKKAAENLQHNYTWMVITEAWCGDSAQNLPVIAEIAKLNPGKIKLYILLRDENPEMMDNYLTNRARAIPKLIAVNETLGKQAFVWGPRPAPAQELLRAWKKNPEGKSWDEFEKELHGWYAKDKTKSLQHEFIQLLHLLS